MSCRLPAVPQLHGHHLDGLVEPAVGGVEEGAAAVERLVRHRRVVAAIADAAVETQPLLAVEGGWQRVVDADDEQAVFDGCQSLGV